MSTSVISLPNAGSGAALATGGSGIALWTQASLFLSLFGILLVVVTLLALVKTSYSHRQLHKAGRFD